MVASGRRRRRLLTTCCIFLTFVFSCHLLLATTTHRQQHPHPDDARADIGRRRLLQASAGDSTQAPSIATKPPVPDGAPAPPITVAAPPGDDVAVAGLVNAEFNCTRPAIERFPPPGMNQAMRQRGGVVVYIAAALYCFLGLAIVCDDYFVPALEVTANALHLSEDVAGATFLAAGSSAPEFATTMLGVFVTKDDIGISGVIGSAVFNAMLVIALVSLLIDYPIQFKRYPMLRDTGCYMVAIGALLAVIYDNTITWYESLLLVSLYVVYCVVMWKNRSLEKWVLDRLVRTPRTEKQSLLKRRANGIVHDPPDDEIDDLAAAVQQEMTGDVEEVPYNDDSPFQFPESTFGRIMYVLSLPVTVCCYLTMPDVGKRHWRPYYPVTFVMAMLWIAVFSYIMIWMITVVGFTLNIPDTIMGLSFVAIGVSIPDVLASVAVARDGYGDMAVSNALGSNVFDILFCMGIPWLLSTGFVTPGSTVKVDSGGVLYSTFFLLTTVVFLLAATSLSRWRLSRPYGVSLLLWYAVFLAVACMYEMNVFGQLTLPMCPSTL